MYRNWTREEDEIILDENLTRQEKSRQTGRSIGAIDQRIHKLNSNKISKSQIKDIKMPCPNCGETRRIGKVTTKINNIMTPTNFCINCLTEYTNKGEIVPPYEAKYGEE